MTHELQTDLPRHECNAWTEGNTAHFVCPQCQYHRTIDLDTGKPTLISDGERYALHFGVVVGGVPDEIPLILN